MNYFWQSISQEVLGALVTFLPEFISGIGVFLLFYIAYRACNIAFDKIPVSDNGRKNVVMLLKKVTGILLLASGIITMFGTWGVDITAIVTGLGIAGFAVGFAMKDTLASPLAGIMVLIYKPFEIGNTIETCGVEGTVTAIDMRYTTLEHNGQKHLIPNARLLSERVTVSRG